MFSKKRPQKSGEHRASGRTGSADSGRRIGAPEAFAIALSVGFLAFIAGGVITQMGVQPVANFMQRTSMVLNWLYESKGGGFTVDPFWTKAHLPGPGSDNPVMRYEPKLTASGLNLVLNADMQGARLVTMDGAMVHEWRRRFDEIWSDAPQLADYRDQNPEYWRDKIYWRRAHLYANGDILVVFETPFRTPYGIGLAKLDRNSHLLWKLSENVHHDMAIGPDGEIYVLGQSINEEGYRDYPGLEPPFIDDSVVVVSQDGEKQKKISIIRAFLNSQYAPFLDLMDKNLQGDVMHGNTVQYINAETARRFPFAKTGQLLISLREMNAIALLDPATERIDWAQIGIWRAQHEPKLLNNGHILMFDNLGHRGPGGPSRVVEFDPVTGAVVWEYTGTVGEPLFSQWYGSEQRLANGNTLIVESQNGRALEVTPARQIIWEYRSPHRKTEGGSEYVMLLTDLVRIDPGSLTFLDN